MVSKIENISIKSTPNKPYLHVSMIELAMKFILTFLTNICYFILDFGQPVST